MKERAYIYAGETVVLRFEARKEGQILDLSGYDVEIDIATTAMGTHLVKQSAKERSTSRKWHAECSCVPSQPKIRHC